MNEVNVVEAIAQKLAEGVSKGHTHARCCRKGCCDTFLPIERAIARADWYYFVSTGFPVETNYNRHAYTPVIVDLSEDRPKDDFMRFLNS